MPWNEVKLMRQKQQLVEKLLQPNANVTAVCAAQGISRKTAYKWLNRYREEGLEGLEERSRAKKQQPFKVPSEVELFVVELNQRHPYWGPRKLHKRLSDEYGLKVLPSIMAISRILKRTGCTVLKSSLSAPAKKRFERDFPNDLWQIDFKGSYMTGSTRCYPLSILDDHSRYSIGLKACANEQYVTVKEHLINVFQDKGLPYQINADNGNPWGSSHDDSLTALAVWLMKLGIKLTHSAPYHPQTNGKIERFHRTLKLEVLHDRCYKNLLDMQNRFDDWRHCYNYQRPHDALLGQTPSTRYTPSERAYPTRLKQAEYAQSAIVRKVTNGMFRFQGKRFRAGKGLNGEFIAIEETAQVGVYSLFFMDKMIKKFHINDGL